MAVLYILISILQLYFPPTFGVGGEFDFLQNAMKAHPTDHEMWCYLEPHCKQGSLNSSWERGLCRHGTSQSPINLDSNLNSSVKESKTLNFNMKVRSQYNLPEYRLEHKGHTVRIVPEDNHNITFSYPEKHQGIYKLHDLHFHWGPSNQVGSEHQIDSKTFGMEVHIVHYRSGGPASHPGYSSIREAVLSGDKNALAVVALMLHVDYDLDQPSFLEPVSSILKLVSHEGNRTFLRRHPMKLGNLLMKQKQAFAYDGSLTTPPCSEIVTWLICKMPVHVREWEVEAFRNVSMIVSKAERNMTEVKEFSTLRKLQGTETLPGKGSKENRIHVRLLDLH